MNENDQVEDPRAKKKEIILEYLTRLPIYKWAAKAAGINQDTLKNWRDADSEFADRCESARSEAINKLANRATPDFILAAADSETFGKNAEQKDSTTYNININGLIGLSKTPTQTTISNPALVEPED